MLFYNFICVFAYNSLFYSVLFFLLEVGFVKEFSLLSKEKVSVRLFYSAGEDTSRRVSLINLSPDKSGSFLEKEREGFGQKEKHLT